MLCSCEELDKETQRIRIRSESRRYGKIVTIIEGLSNPNELARTLKKAVAAGGTIKNGHIELQGEHREKVGQILQKLGYQVRIV